MMQRDLRAVPARLSRIIGLEATLRVVDRFGGTTLYVPLRPSPHYRLAQALDERRFAALCEAFGGRYVDLPTDAYAADTKKEEILSLAGSGLSGRAIAKRVGCSWRYACAVLQGIDRGAA